ncbi:hypothetical protein WJX72_006635 [[Myrmecia] bisecta]|uniref:Uncharacterized protein n=1 Tax=[Myrmecia] bisecta TaxID=41462 RepID=A0AAW1PIM3_9CHLO
MASAQLEWQEVATDPSERPTLPRSGHSAAPLPAGHAEDTIIIGGYTETADKQREACIEAWTFLLAEKRWCAVSYAAGPVPRVRLAAQAVVVGNHLWLIGGWDPGHNKDGGAFLDDIWRLDLQDYSWQQVKPEGEALPAISRFQAAAVSQKIYIHTHRSIDDILVLDVASPDAPMLAKVGVTGEAGTPPSRGLHTLTAVGGKLYLFAGAPQRGGMLADLWVLDLASMQWRQLRPEGAQPHVRCSQTAAAVGDQIYYHGGSYYREDGSGLQPLDDNFGTAAEGGAAEEQEEEAATPPRRRLQPAEGVTDDSPAELLTCDYSGLEDHIPVSER